jgi:hypothetical protein
MFLSVVQADSMRKKKEEKKRPYRAKRKTCVCVCSHTFTESQIGMCVAHRTKFNEGRRGRRKKENE